MPHAIEIEQLTKTFRPQTGIRRWFSSSCISHDIKVLDDVTLHVQAGEVFGLLGPNGAGKTTLLKVLSTLIRPDRGSVRILGYDLVRDEYRIKERVGMVYPDERSFYWRLSGRENLRFFGSLLNLSIREIDRRTRELSSLMNMDNFLDDRYDAYSTGMKQRLLVARAMLREPAVLLMDEPTRGLDPGMAEGLLKQIRSLALNKQTTILMVTHRLAEARNFCDRIGILDRGRLVCDGSIEDLKASFLDATRYCFYMTSLDISVLSRMEGLPWITGLQWTNGGGEIRVELDIQDPVTNLSRVFDLFRENRALIVRMEAGEWDMETIFSRAISREAG